MFKILILDDNEDILDIVHEVLTYEQFEVKTLTKSIGFITIAESFQPDLIVLDYRLADGNGADICRMIKKHPGLNHIPVIIYSAYIEKGSHIKDVAPDAVINKPFDLNVFVETVNWLLTSTTRR